VVRPWTLRVVQAGQAAAGSAVPARWEWGAAWHHARVTARDRSVSRLSSHRFTCADLSSRPLHCPRQPGPSLDASSSKASVIATYEGAEGSRVQVTVE